MLVKEEDAEAIMLTENTLYTSMLPRCVQSAGRNGQKMYTAWAAGRVIKTSTHQAPSRREHSTARYHQPMARHESRASMKKCESIFLIHLFFLHKYSIFHYDVVSAEAGQHEE